MIQFAPLKVKSKKVLKEHTYVKRVQNNVYNKHKAELSDDDTLIHVNFAESYRNDQQDEIKSANFESQSFLHCVVMLKVRNKSVVVKTRYGIKV